MNPVKYLSAYKNAFSEIISQHVIMCLINFVPQSDLGAILNRATERKQPLGGQTDSLSDNQWRITPQEQG